MSILNTIYNIAHMAADDVDSLKDVIDDKGGSPVKNFSYDSIAKQSKNGVMQFPFIASRSLTFDNMELTAKAAERNFASFLQVIFTMNQITNADQPVDFIRQYHQNMNADVNGPKDVLSFIFNSSIPASVRNEIMKEVAEGNITYEDMFEMNSLNSAYIPQDTKITFAKITMEAQRRGSHNQARATWRNPGAPVIVSNDRSGNKTTINNTTINRGGDGEGGSARMIKDPSGASLPRNIFTDSDVKKANEMVPTLMQVRMFKEYPNGESKYIDFIVGVKSTIHAIDSKDMIDHLVGVFQDRGTLFKLITWTTGEISFLKDLIFNVDQIKDEIKGVRNGKYSIWWTALKNAKAKRRMHKYTFRSPILPNASIVISMEEVDYIRANYGFDVLEDSSGKKLIDDLNILSMYIVDAASEVVYCMVDGQDHYDIITFKGLERAAGNGERQFKDILRAVNKLQ